MMNQVEISALPDSASWIVRGSQGSAGIAIDLRIIEGASTGLSQILSIGIAASCGVLRVEFRTHEQDWRRLIQHHDQRLFFGKALGHAAWDIDEAKLASNIEACIDAARPGCEERRQMHGQLPEAVRIIRGGGEVLPDALGKVLPDDWDETIVPRSLKKDLAEFWSDYWVPFRKQMRTEMLAGLPQPGVVRADGNDASERDFASAAADFGEAVREDLEPVF